MATKEFNSQIKTRKDTDANWTSANPVLLDGERILVVMTCGKVREKIGNGTSTYTQLPFVDYLDPDSTINGGTF